MTARKKKQGNKTGPEQQQERSNVESKHSQNGNLKQQEKQAAKEQPSKQEHRKKQPKSHPVEQSKQTKQQEQFDPLHAMAFWGLAALLFFPPYFQGLFFAPQQEKALMLAALVFWLTFLWRWLQNDHKFLRGPLDWFALAMPVVYIISTFTAVNKGLAIDDVVKNILYFMTYWSVSRLVRNQEDIHKLLQVIYISAIGVALAGLAAATSIININDGFLAERIYSTFQYPNALASYLGAVSLVGLYLWRHSRDHTVGNNLSGRGTGLPEWLIHSNPWSYLYTGGNFLLLAVLMGTQSRGGLLVFGLVFLIYLAGIGAKNRLTAALHVGFTGLFAVIAVNKFIPLAAGVHPGQAWIWIIGGLLGALAWQAAFRLLDRKILAVWADNARRYNQVFAAMAVAVVIAAAVWLPANTGVLDKISDSDYLRTGFQRVYYIGTAWEMTLDRPLLGWGGGGWKEAYQSFMDYNYTTREVHSFYFQLGVETGFPGLLAVAGIWVSFLYLAFRLYRSPENPAHRPLIWTLTTAFLMIAGHALIDFDLSLSALTIVLWSIFGITAGLVMGASADRREGKKYVPPNYFPAGAATAVAVIIFTGSLVLAQSHAHMNRGMALLRSQQTAGVEYVEKAAAYNPLNADFRITLSRVYGSMGEPEKALAEAQRAVELSPYAYDSFGSRNNPGPRINLVQIALAAGKPDIAVDAVEKTAELAPNRIEVYQNTIQVYALLGQSALQKGDKQEARGYFEKCLQVPDRMESYWNGLSETSLRMWKGPKLEVNRNMQLYLGQTRYWLGEFKAAEKLLDQAAKDKNLAGEALLYLVLAKDKQDQGEEARQYLEQAQEAAPGIEKNYEALSGMDTL